MKKILMFVATLLALAVVITGCATKRDTIGTMEQTSPKSESECQEQDSTELFNSKDWEDWDKAKELTNEVISTRQKDALQYEPHGVYNLSDQSYKTYTFDAPNDFYEVVMINNDESIPFIIHNTGNHGVSFQSIVYNGGKFVGLTSNFVLFETADGTVKAVSIKEKEECQIGEYQFDVFDFNELSKEEQESAICPNGSYDATF